MIREFPMLSQLQYCNLSLQGIEHPVVALKDNGAEISLIKENLVSQLNLPKLGTIVVRGVVGDPVQASLVTLNVRPCPDEGWENIAPHIPIVFAACDLSTDVDIILSGDIVNQINELNAYNVLKCSVELPREQEVSVAVTTRSGKVYDQSMQTSVVNDDKDKNNSAATDDLSMTDALPTTDMSDRDALREEQLADESLKKCWSWAKVNKGNFYVENGLLYHQDHVLGQKVQQLCLPKRS